MKLKKFYLSAVLFFSVFAGNVYGSGFMFFRAGEYGYAGNEGFLPETKIGAITGRALDAGEMVWIGLFDARLLFNYTARYWPGDVYKSSLDTGEVINLGPFDTGFTQYWNIENNSWDFFWRLGLSVDICTADWGLFNRFKDTFYDHHCGFEPEMYIEVPFDDIKKFRFVFGLSFLLSSVDFYSY